MKIAICLFGQLRDYKFGYECIKKFIELNDEHTCDFFFHCWIDNDIAYECSSWRSIDARTLHVSNADDVKKEIIELYKPLSHLFEKPLDKTNEDVVKHMECIKKSMAYSNSSQSVKNNIFNIFSQICTRSRVKDLFEEYITKTDAKYDLVISTRFDGYGFPNNFKIPTIVKNKIYAFRFGSSPDSPTDRQNHRLPVYSIDPALRFQIANRRLPRSPSLPVPRYILIDFFLLIPPEIYVKFCNLYENIEHIINNNDINAKLNYLNERLIFNAEEYLLANYIFCGYNPYDIVFMRCHK